jgi:DNA-binding Lrp family transcriptional regulator
MSRIERREMQDVSARVPAIAAFSFLTNHGLVLLCIATDPRSRMRDLAERVGITERATQRIVADLVGAGYIERTRVGRRNEYSVRLDLAIDVPNARDVDLNTLLGVLVPSDATATRREQIADTARGL